MNETLNKEEGYSLIEVVVAILILAVAILPMASMFDSALNASQNSGDYDKARALAHRSLEEIRALDYEKTVEIYGAPTPQGCDEGKFECGIETAFVGDDLQPNENTKTRMLVAVEVEWDGKTYETSSLVAASKP